MVPCCTFYWSFTGQWHREKEVRKGRRQEWGIRMQNVTVYVKCERNLEVAKPDVYVADIASVSCADKPTEAKCRAVKVYHFSEKEPKRCVISALKLVEKMEEVCPGITVQPIGEADVLVEWVQVGEYKGWRQWIKVFFVCLISFFGTAFTIMAYHNDVGINDVFTEIYRMVMNQEPAGLNTLEVSYSVGLAAGIILFFNHVGGRRLTKDPTPIEVAMRNYEEDVDKTLIVQAGREGKEEEP